ncbi:MAG TPA: hypothetical protein VHV55_04245 [Pirellulales bacterium]|jgi:hypothetical protein|nr:hypothetical protein [Pirellulales bacterium]
MPTDTLDRELVHYEDSFGEVEVKWKLLPKELGLRAKVEDTVGIGLAVLAQIDQTNEQWIESVRAGNEPFLWHKAAKVARRYRWWLSLSSLVMDAIEWCEQHSEAVDGAGSFRVSYNRVAAMSLDIESVKKAFAA